MTKMRTAIPVIILAATIVGAIPAPANAPHCETIACYTAECWWAGPGHRRCRRVCRRRCWNDDSPAYVAPSFPEPQYSAPSRPSPTYRVPPPVYEPARRHTVSRLNIEPFFLWSLVALLATAVVAAISAAFSGSSFDTEIAKTEQTARWARALAQDAENKAQAIDQFISAAERHAAARGRAAADKEWAGE